MSEDTDNLIEVDEREYREVVAEAYERGKADGFKARFDGLAPTDRRFTAAVAAMQAIVTRDPDAVHVARDAVYYADELLAELAKEGK